jgi:hypothetical protein
LIAISNNKLFRIDNRSNSPKVKILFNGENFYFGLSGLYKDRAGKLILYDNYNDNLYRINFFDDTCSFDTLLEEVPVKICQDDSGNIWLLNMDYSSFLYRWDGQSVTMKRLTGAGYNSARDYCIASDTEEICIVVQTSHSFLISKYRFSDFSLSTTDSLNMDYDSSRIINAFIVGGKFNLLLDIQELQLVPGEKDSYYKQSVIATVEQDSVLFRECWYYPDYWDSSPVFKKWSR